MKRFIIFTVLFPPLALVLFIGTDPIWRRESLEIGLLLWMLGYAYLIAIIPTWLTAGVDWALSAWPKYLRLVATTVVAAVLAEMTARYLGQRGDVLTFVSMGAIPAALCSWLSGRTKESSRSAAIG